MFEERRKEGKKKKKKAEEEEEEEEEGKRKEGRLFFCCVREGEFCVRRRNEKFLLRVSLVTSFIHYSNFSFSFSFFFLGVRTNSTYIHSDDSCQNVVISELK